MSSISRSTAYGGVSPLSPQPRRSSQHSELAGEWLGCGAGVEHAGGRDDRRLLAVPVNAITVPSAGATVSI